MKLVCISVCAFLLVISCQQVKQNDVATINDSMVSPIMEKHFHKDEIKEITKVIRYFEKGMCTGHNASDLDRCYDLHSHGLRSDILNQVPTQNNYPYNTNDGLHQVTFNDKLTQVWSNECKFVNSKNGKETNYYCYNLSGSYMDYLTEVGKENSLIQSYAKQLTEEKGLGNALIQQVMMSSVEQLEFKNVDHRIFYTIHYLTQRDQNLKSKIFTSL